MDTRLKLWPSCKSLYLLQFLACKLANNKEYKTRLVHGLLDVVNNCMNVSSVEQCLASQTRDLNLYYCCNSAIKLRWTNRIATNAMQCNPPSSREYLAISYLGPKSVASVRDSTNLATYHGHVTYHPLPHFKVPYGHKVEYNEPKLPTNEVQW